ncbi:MAG: hypothetical protein ABI634_19410 [Acidobacteriota bacterium]
MSTVSIDRGGRDRLAAGIRHLASGAVTNLEFEDRAEFDSPDPAIQAVFWGGPWQLYSDFRSYRLRGPDRLPNSVRREAARWILFLKTDLPYEWPPARRGLRGLAYSIAWLAGSLATAGLIRVWAKRSYAQLGDISVWPFIHRSDYDVALKTAPYLGGGSRPAVS